jgi:hypothetical protein
MSVNQKETNECSVTDLQTRGANENESGKLPAPELNLFARIGKSTHSARLGCAQFQAQITWSGSIRAGVAAAFEVKTI